MHRHGGVLIMAKKIEREIIETSTAMKQIYRHYFISYILKDDVDAIESLYKIARHLINDKKINTLKEDLGKNYDTIMKRFNAFIPHYQLAQQYRKILVESSDTKVKEETEEKLRNLCRNLPAINDSIILVFTALVRNTDLKNIPIPHPNIRSERSDSMPLSFSEERRSM